MKQQILALLAEGKTYKEIAESFCCAKSTTSMTGLKCSAITTQAAAGGSA